MKKKLINLFYLIILLFTYQQPLPAEYADYQKVMEGSNAIAGSFSEFRHTHLHAGTDLSTDNKIGYKVFAIDDGYLQRIKITPDGYGKAIYLKLNDGNIVVYAHLSDFSKKIKKLIKKEQKKENSYYIDSYFEADQIPITQSEHIAYSGNTGGTSPHLHLEFRNEKEEPINIFLNEKIKKSPFFNSINPLNKNQAPLIKNLALIPQNTDSFINGQNAPYITKPTKQDDNYYFLKETITVSGQIKIAVEAYDFVRSNKIGISQAKLTLNDNDLFTVSLNSFPYSKYFKVFSIYELHLFLNEYPRFLKLFKTTANNLQFSANYPVNSGIIDTNILNADKAHKINIQVTNSTNTTQSSVNFTFNIVQPITLNNFNFDSTAKKLKFTISSITHLKRILLLKSKIDTTQWEPFTTIIPQNNNIEIPLDINSNSLIKAVAEDVHGTKHSMRIFPILQTKEADYSIDKDKIEYAINNYKDYLEIKFITPKPIITMPKLGIKTLDQNFEINVSQQNINTFVGHFQLSKIKQKTDAALSIEITDCNNQKTIINKVLPITPITPENGGTIISDDKNFTLMIPRHAIYSDSYPILETITDKKNYPPLNEHQQKELIIVSPIYDLTPKDEIANKFEVTIKNKNQLVNAGIFLFFREKWKFLGADIINNNSIKGKTRYFGKFALIQDNTPPKIYAINPRNEQIVYDKLFTIKAKITDNGSDLNYKKISLWLNDKKMLPEYDINSSSLITKLDKNLAKGKHSINIQAEDRTGNKNSVKSIFYIK